MISYIKIILYFSDKNYIIIYRTQIYHNRLLKLRERERKISTKLTVSHYYFAVLLYLPRSLVSFLLPALFAVPFSRVFADSFFSHRPNTVSFVNTAGGTTRVQPLRKYHILIIPRAFFLPFAGSAYVIATRDGETRRNNAKARPIKIEKRVNFTVCL